MTRGFVGQHATRAGALTAAGVLALVAGLSAWPAGCAAPVVGAPNHPAGTLAETAQAAPERAPTPSSKKAAPEKTLRAFAGRAAAAQTSSGDEDEDARRPLNPVVSIEDWLYDGVRGSAVTTPNYRVYTTLPSGVLLSRTPRFLELALIHYTTALGDLPDPQRPMDTFLLANRNQWAQATVDLTGRDAETYLRIQRGGYARRGSAVYWDIGAHDTLAIAAHEGWHQYTQSAFRDPLPLWLEEGLACYMEGFRWSDDDPHTPDFRPWANHERFDTLRELVADDRVLDLSTLMNSRPQDLLEYSNQSTLDYYAQVWALTHFLNEGAGGVYAADLRRIVSDASDGTYRRSLRAELPRREAMISLYRRVGSGPFRVYFNDDFEAVETEFRAFLKEITETGARDAITAGRSPLRDE